MKRKRTFTRAAHGKAAEGGSLVMVEAPPIDEMPNGIPAEAVEPTEGDFDARGKFAPNNTMAAAGGKARTGVTKLGRRLGLSELAKRGDFGPYYRSGLAWRRAQCSSLAKSVGGGVCGPGPSSIIATAAWQLAASRYLFDKAAEQNEPALFVQASKLGNDSRQNLLAAHSLCALEAESREHDSVGLDAARLAFQQALASQPGRERVNALPDVRVDVDEPESRQEPVTGQDGATTDEVPE